MRKLIFIVTLFTLAACAREGEPPDAVEETRGNAAGDLTMANADRVDPKSAEAAARMAQEYFDLIERGLYAEAWGMWADDGGAAGMSQAEFAKSFADYRRYDAEVRVPGRVEGAAGSLYVEVPVVVTGALKNGELVERQGSVVLRRVNDVPGATPEQLQWRVYRSDLLPEPAAETR